MAGEPILVIDDNPLNIKLARAVLEKAGYEIHAAGDAATALAKLASFQPRLIILDLVLPEIDGFELATMLKSDARYRDIPIIAMTASGLANDQERAKAAGCEAYVEKPFELDVLLATVARCLHETN